MFWIPSIFFLAASLTPEQAIEIGVKVWQNECAGTIDGLTSWNEGEEFASLGIGHFIWYPPYHSGPYLETFPELVKYLKEQKVDFPRWIEEAHGCPWKTREQFKRAVQLQSKQMVDLRNLLRTTVPLQAQFLQSRLDKALPALIDSSPEEKKAKIQKLYDRILAHPKGTYVLLDYVNFKGYGTSVQERYNGWGWGLYQVLDAMNDNSDQDPIIEFVQAAKNILEQRVKNAPSIRNEDRYLKGWFLRLDTYLAK